MTNCRKCLNVNKVFHSKETAITCEKTQEKGRPRGCAAGADPRGRWTEEAGPEAGRGLRGLRGGASGGAGRATAPGGDGGGRGLAGFL